MAKLFANNGDPDQILQSAAFDLVCSVCQFYTLLGVSRQKWVKVPSKFVAYNSLKLIFLLFIENKTNISCELSSKIHMNCQVLFSMKNKTKYFKVSSAVVVISALRDNWILS